MADSGYSTIPAVGDAPGKALLAVEWTTFLLVVAAIAIRFWAIQVQGRRSRFDDWACVFSAVFVLGLTIVGTISVALSGLGQLEPTPESLALTFKLYAPKEICWSFANTSVKLSFLGFFRHVFSLDKYKYRFYITGAMIVCLGIGNILQSLVMCRPFAYLWDKTIPGGVCGNQDLALLLVAVLSVFVDVVIFSLPIPILWTLQLSKQKKRSLMVIFCLGILVTVVPLVRIGLTVPLIREPQSTAYWVGIIETFYHLELSLSIIAACVPAWRPLFANKDSGNSGDSTARSLKNFSERLRHTSKYVGRPGGSDDKRPFDVLKSTSGDGDMSPPVATLSRSNSASVLATDEVEMGRVKRDFDGDDVAWSSKVEVGTQDSSNPADRGPSLANAITVTTSWDVVGSAR